jgi:ABC-type multidrug transport system fused ATPase/permease subunit
MYTQDKTIIKTMITEINAIPFSLAGLWHITLLFGVLALVGVTVCVCQLSLLIALICCLLVLFALGSIVVAAPSYLKARAKYYWSLAKSETK